MKLGIVNGKVVYIMTPAKKIKHDDDRNKENSKTNQNILNPLEVVHILRRVLNYLDVGSLKESRLVGSLWRLVGGKILLKKCNVLLYYLKNGDSSKNEILLQKFLFTTSPFDTYNLAVDKNNDVLKNILPLLLHQTRSLTYEHSYSIINTTSQIKFNGSTLPEILKYFPNLQILYIVGDFVFPNGLSPESEKPFWKKLESLQEIRLKFYRNQFDTFIYALMMRNEKIQVKEINLVCVDSVDFLQRYLRYEIEWPLDTLFLMVGSSNSSHLNLIELFLRNLSGTLKHLEWLIGTDTCLMSEYFIPWTKKWIIPPTLTHLETLKIYQRCWRQNEKSIVLKLLISALELPNLKKLTMDTVPNNLKENIRAWNKKKRSGKSLKSHSLEKLEILRVGNEMFDAVPTNSYIIFSRRLWPNLKSLHLKKPPMELPTSFKLSKWIGLEQLDIEFDEMNQSQVDLWTKWLTGRDPASSEFNENTFFTLKDLKNLKHFGIVDHSPCVLSTPRLATDFFGINGLQHMTQLQSLHVKNSTMSNKVKEMIKKALGPTVSVVIPEEKAKSMVRLHFPGN